MGLHFRKSFKIAPGVRLNLGKKSSSVTFGGKLFRKTFSSTGRRTTSSSIPGTGLYFTSSSGGKSRKRKSKSKSTATAPKKQIKKTTPKVEAAPVNNTENQNTQAGAPDALGCMYLMLGVLVVMLAIALLSVGAIAFAVLFPLLLIPMWMKCKEWSTGIKGLITALTLALWLVVLAILAMWYSDSQPPADPVVPQSVSVESTPENLAVFAVPTNTASPTPTPKITPTPRPTSAPTDIPTPKPTNTPVPTPSPIPVLKKGMTGEAVSQMQQRLIFLGYLDGRADGDFGSGTEQAVKDFQKKHGLQADGVAGSKTLNTLFSENAEKQIWVWIPTKGGSKYHSNQGCSSMEDPVKVKLEEAEKRGFEPCSKC